MMSKNNTQYFSYGIDTYKINNFDEYVAVVSTPLLLDSDPNRQKVQPVAVGPSREEAITAVKDAVAKLTFHDLDEHVIISIRHHDEYMCVYCFKYPVHDTYESLIKHVKIHTNIPEASEDMVQRL